MLIDSLNIDWPTSGNRPNNTSDYARIIQSKVSFIKDMGGSLYYYQNGAYRYGGDTVVREAYIAILERIDDLSRWSKAKAEEILGFITVRSNVIWERPPMHKINLLNGIYNWELEMLEPHTTEWCSTVQIPINHNKDATCPTWDKFLSEVFPEGDMLLREIIGLCMIPFMGLQKCIVLVGGGANGKSTYLNGLRAAIGKDNISSRSLHDICSDRWAKADLVGKLVNVFSDMPLKGIEDAANFKGITGEDTISVEYKHKNPFPYTPFCKLIFSCNEVVKAEDKSEGYRRRFINIPFVRQFAVDPKVGQELAYSLSDPRELSGLLNTILPRIPSIVEDGFSITPEIAAIISDYTPEPQNVKDWFDRWVVAGTDFYVPMSPFYTHYCETLLGLPGGNPLERGKLVSFLKTHFPGLKANVSTKIKDKVVKCYWGIKLKDDTKQDEMIEIALRSSLQGVPTNVVKIG